MIFILEDDEGILSLVMYALSSANLKAKGFGTPKEFWDAMSKELPSCIVLDVMLPQEDGLSILRKIRTNHKSKNIPIILLTALGSEFDKIKGLDSGADDYLTKPFSALELIARIKALLRRSNTNGNLEINFLDLKYSKLSHSVSIKDEPIHLTLKEFELLGLLMSSPNRVFSREELLEIIWGYNISGTRTIDIHINTLRNKIKEYSSYIKTIRGVGYQFSAN
ncbi:response regulator transcription factor [Helicobacter jaachi]|uniref:Response regulator transcription factor n=1 Tax=Helicobacter jaachi TaxID=1677920 RepID=A0A4U8TC91_9HELI|nr:response regulator transcription factor [Helicobacter jaachi]TLD97423.1 response regulator transcription factor [Helicobacter jaachi]